jgi:hypothetical protein
MTTQTKDRRIDEMRHRIDRLEAKVQAAGADAKASMKSQLDALRRHEESTRAAFSEAVDAKASEASDHAQAANGKYLELESRLGAAEHALAADVAEDDRAFTDAMKGYLDDVRAFFARLEAKAGTKTGAAQQQAEDAVSDARHSKETLAKHLAELRESSGERWHEQKRHVAATRAELERKLEEAWRKLES